LLLGHGRTGTRLVESCESETNVSGAVQCTTATATARL
jgi:hypothetical protein